jgi:hypothetical protein
MKTTTAAEWNNWLADHNAKYRALSNDQKLNYLRNFLGAQKTTEREQFEIQRQIDGLELTLNKGE